MRRESYLHEIQERFAALGVAANSDEGGGQPLDRAVRALGAEPLETNRTCTFIFENILDTYTSSLAWGRRQSRGGGERRLRLWGEFTLEA